VPSSLSLSLLPTTITSMTAGLSALLSSSTTTTTTPPTPTTTTTTTNGSSIYSLAGTEQTPNFVIT